MDDMEDIGSYYAVVLHDPLLRRGRIAVANESQLPSPNARSGERLHFWLACAFRALAIRIEPRQRQASATGCGTQRSLLPQVALSKQGGDH
jgi:hypothetical protein